MTTKKTKKPVQTPKKEETIDTKKNDISMNFLKTGTYAIVGTIGALVIQAIGEGVDLKTALIYGISVGTISGIKNYLKYAYDLDLDFTKIKSI